MDTQKTVMERGKFYFAHPSIIKTREGWNPRFDFGDLADITIENGFHKHQPLLVKRTEKGKLEIIDGERRWAKVQLLLAKGVKFDDGIPVVLADKSLDDNAALIQTLTSNHGKPLLPLEEAAAYARLKAGGMTIKEICKAVGRSDMHICDTLALIDADPALKEALKAGKIGATVAKAIAIKAKGDKPEQARLAAEAASGKAGTAAVKDKLQRKRVKKFSKGPVVKAQRVLTANALERREQEVLERLDELLKAVGVKRGSLRKFIRDSDENSLGYAAGLLQGLRIARGVETDTSV